MAKTEKSLEKKLLTRVNKKLKESIKDTSFTPQNIDDVIKKIELEVKEFVKLHEKEYKELSLEEREQLTNPTYILRVLIEVYYSKEKLDKVLRSNLKRIPGNLADPTKQEELYSTFAKFDYSCPYSETPLLYGAPIHLDHIIPITLGGPTDDWNVVPVCESCNESKNNKHLLEWWDKSHKPNEEYKLVKIFEHMTEKLISNIKNGEYRVDTGFDQTQQNDEEYLVRLDPITFLFQLLKHIESNKDFILSPNANTTTDNKYKELESTFNRLVKLNNKSTHLKTDLSVLQERENLVQEVKSYGVVDYYYVAFAYFDDIMSRKQQLKRKHLSDKMISQSLKEYCLDLDPAFNVDRFINKLNNWLDTHNGEYPKRLKMVAKNIASYREKQRLGTLTESEKDDLDEYDFAKQINSIRTGNIKLSEDDKKKLDKAEFVWNGGFDVDEFLEKLKTWLTTHNGEYPKRRKMVAKNIASYREKQRLNILTDSEKAELDEYAFAQQITSVRTGTIKLSEDDKKKLHKAGFVWNGGFDVDEFLEKLKTWLTTHNAEYPKILGKVIKDIATYRKKQRLNTLTDSEKAELYEYDFAKQIINVRTGNIKLSEDDKKKLDKAGFVWEGGFDVDEFIIKLNNWLDTHNGEYPKQRKMVRKNITLYRKKQKSGTLTESEKAELYEYDFAMQIHSVRTGKIKLSEDHKKKLDKAGFVWIGIAYFDADEFIVKLNNWLATHNGEYPKRKNISTYREKQKLGTLTDSEKAELDEYTFAQQITSVRTGHLKLSEDDKKKLHKAGFVWASNARKSKDDTIETAI